MDLLVDLNKPISLIKVIKLENDNSTRHSLSAGMTALKHFIFITFFFRVVRGLIEQVLVNRGWVC